MTFVGNFIVAMGLLLIFLGACFVVLSFLGAAHAAWTKLHTAPKKKQGITKTAENVVPKTIAALTGFLKALSTSPIWLSTIIIGCALVWFGQRASVLAWPFN